MADLSQTAANVRLVSGNATPGTSGEALVAGNSCYLKASDNKFYKAFAKSTQTAEISGANGLYIALNSAPGADQPISLAGPGSVVNIGATLTVGETYTVSENAAGAIAPISDLGTGDFVSYLGNAATAANLNTTIMSATSTAKA
jgi:hypothetical protein